jgi:deoxyribodipyrimidine photolyase-related protein
MAITLRLILGDQLNPQHGWFRETRDDVVYVLMELRQETDYVLHHAQKIIALLAGLDPAQVHRWYLGNYIDAFEWVGLPNTLGMSQFADGGLMATKPYVSSAAYINRMSDYCKQCHYDRKLRVGERACPYNALYWDFFAHNKDRLANNPRLGMVFVKMKKMGGATIKALQAQTDRVRQRLDQL